jgi:hypothetical protein
VRSEQGDELLGTLRDGDEERGRSSHREVLALVVHGLGRRCAPEYAGGSLLAVGVLAVFVALAPDDWWGHHAVATVPPWPRMETAFGPQPPLLRMLLAGGGLVAIGRHRLVLGVLAALIVPYGLFVSSGVPMFGVGALALRRDELVPLLVVSAATALGLVAIVRGLRRVEVPTATLACAGMVAACSFATLLATVDASLGGFGNTVAGSAAPTVLGGFGPASVGCAAAGVLAGAVAARSAARAGLVPTRG